MALRMQLYWNKSLSQVLSLPVSWRWVVLDGTVSLQCLLIYNIFSNSFTKLLTPDLHPPRIFGFAELRPTAYSDHSPHYHEQFPQTSPLMSPNYACADYSLHFHKSQLCVQQVALRTLNEYVPLEAMLLPHEPAMLGWTTSSATKLTLPTRTTSSPRGSYEVILAGFMPVVISWYLLVWRNDLPRQTLCHSHSSDLSVTPVKLHSSLTLQKLEALRVYLINLLRLIMAGDRTSAIAKSI